MFRGEYLGGKAFAGLCTFFASPGAVFTVLRIMPGTFVMALLANLLAKLYHRSRIGGVHG